MKIKHIKNISIFLGLSFFCFNNSSSLAQCGFGKQVGPDAVSCACWKDYNPSSTVTVFTHLAGATREQACQKCIASGYNFTGCLPSKE